MKKVTEVVISIDPVSTRVAVVAPYSPEFNGEARAMGGKWDGIERRWVFPRTAEANVRALCLKIHGTDGGTAKPSRALLEDRLAMHLQAVTEIQAQLERMDEEGV